MTSEKISTDCCKPWSIPDSYRYCESITHAHYENFPVASWWVPKAMRPHVAAIYAFARQADDFADEGENTGKEISLLAGWEKNLRLCYEGQARFPTFVALADTVRRFDLPMQLFLDLLDAFKQDVLVHRYETFGDVLHYCRRSANPVGRLVLRMFGHREEQHAIWSDAICTALQLANFWQDVARDWQKGRVYIPMEDFRRFGYTVEELGEAKQGDAFRAMMSYQVDRTQKLFQEGQPLLKAVQGRLRWELTLIWLGGMRILSKIQAVDFDVLNRRPTLRSKDIAWMLFHWMRGSAIPSKPW